MTVTAVRRLFSAVALAGVLSLASCQTNRPLDYVRQSGDEHYSHQRYAQALTDYEEYTERAPGDARGNYDLGRTLLQLNRVSEAIPPLWVAYDVDSTRPEYVNTLAEALCRAAESATVDLGERAELYRFLNARVKQFPTPEEFIRLGKYAERLGDADEALTAYLTAARIDLGQSLAPQLALAEFHLARGDREEGLRRLRMALYLDQTNAEIAAKIRAQGEIPGPTFALQPAEAP